MQPDRVVDLDESADFRHLEQRLMARFSPPLSAEEVDRCLAECVGRFEGARVRTYVPVLIERAAIDRLRAVVRNGPQPAANLVTLSMIGLAPHDDPSAQTHNLPDRDHRLTTLTFDIASGTLRISLRGELDVTNSPELVQAIDLGLTAHLDVVVDCERLTFIDASGTRALFGSRVGGQVKIVNLRGSPARVIRLLRREAVLASSMK